MAYIVSSTDQRIYLMTTDGEDRVEAQFVPGEIDDNRSNNLVAVQVVARSNDQFQYTGGEDTLNFTFQFYADDENRENAMQQVRNLKALGMSNGRFGKARRIKLVMGKLYRREVWSLRVVNSKLSNFDARHDFMPIFATVNIQLVLNPTSNRTRKQVQTI